ncbi:hypothetical protein FRC11_008750 [Ceratobasidium sp. 423]|nr:hypothetical protein FRC11_008750 [Ceratobasidium sp. 423]
MRDDLCHTESSGQQHFKAHAAMLFYTAVIAPHNKAYVSDLATFIEDDMVRNYPLYKLDKIIIEDEESRGTLNTQMRIKLAAIRNAIKEKLDAAVENGHCMNRLMWDIMPKKIEIRIEHRQRWAWIPAQYKEYRENLSNTSNFWKDLDKILVNAELSLAQAVASKHQRDETRTEIYRGALEKYEKDYPTQIPAPEKVDTPSWQVMLERNLDKYHSF